ncbi:MAG: hypothetical protein JNK16_14905, partial [Phycisphaerales bacterium]|nr:hypothetical protein [Phycisphaerales bacterium]
MQSARRRKEHSAGFWRGFQIAAVLAMVASLIFYMQLRRENFAANSPFAGAVAAQNRAKEKLEADRTLADASPSVAPAPAIATRTENKAAAAAEANFAFGDNNVTIVDVLNLARKAEHSSGGLIRTKPKAGFKPSGDVVSPFDEVNRLAAKVVGCEPAQVSALTPHAAEAVAPKDEPDPRKDFARAAAPNGETRILTFDIMLDVGSRDLAAFQIEISMSAPDTARVTGMLVRGGDHPALQRQPLFDNQRVSKPGARTTFTIANFDTGKDLPSGDVRVARIVLIVVGPGHPGLTARLVIAAGAEGVPIPAGLRVVERAPIAGADLKQKQLEKAVEEAESLPPVK